VTGGSRTIDVEGRRVHVSGDLRPLRPYRGWFYGDPLPAHAHPGDRPDPNAPAVPSGVIVLAIGDRAWEFHRQADGSLHSHAIPFTAFDSIEEAAAQVVEFHRLGVSDGRAARPEETE
jgi:hypothetical protein